jgi:hypothetical protein
MKWGVRKSSDAPRLSRRERLEKAYATKYSDAVAKNKAANRIRTEKILLTVGAVAVTAAVAVVVGKKLHSEFAPINLPQGSSLQNVNNHGDNFDLNRITFATFKKGDNKIYREKFALELSSRSGLRNRVYASELKSIKDLKIPSKSQAKKLYVEWEKSRGIDGAASGKSVIKRMINNNRNTMAFEGNINKPGSFMSYIAEKGYDGIQDVMDQQSSKLRAKAPLMFVNGAQSLVVKGSEAIDHLSLHKKAGFIDQAYYDQVVNNLRG